jgi:hypothetical protein
MTDDLFSICKQAAEKYNKPGHFVTIQAFEQNDIKDSPGHRNIYFRAKAPGIFKGTTLGELYAYLNNHNALIIPHHTLIWGAVPHFNNSTFERLIEIYSMHCSSELKGSPLNNFMSIPIKAETGTSVREVLKDGCKVGFIAGSDNHQGAPGLSGKPGRFTNLSYSGGLAAVFASKLSREAIFDGLYNRHCYATTGKRIYLDFNIADNRMGSEVKIYKGNTLSYQIMVGGTEPIARIELIRDGEEILLWSHDGKDFVKLKGNLTFNNDSWLYVRVTQIDRHMAWSSPIWVNVK